MKILNVTDPAFAKYGRIVEGIDFRELLEAMQSLPVPEDVVYVASSPILEACSCMQSVAYSLYGGMPVQIGYCNGKNKKLNAVEYHRDSEINVAGTDMILLLGQEQDMEADGTYAVDKLEGFLIPEGTAIEVYATTLHYAPCHTRESGFRSAVVLPRGTNTELEKEESVREEDKLLFARNKWLIAHPQAGIEGAFCGLKGENLEV